VELGVAICFFGTKAVFSTDLLMHFASGYWAGDIQPLNEKNYINTSLFRPV